MTIGLVAGGGKAMQGLVDSHPGLVQQLEADYSVTAPPVSPTQDFGQATGFVATTQTQQFDIASLGG